MSHEYESLRRVAFGESDSEHGKCYFVPVCSTCGRFVKVDTQVILDGHGQPKGPNATCKKCGRVEMPFEGYI